MRHTWLRSSHDTGGDGCALAAAALAAPTLAAGTLTASALTAAADATAAVAAAVAASADDPAPLSGRTDAVQPSRHSDDLGLQLHWQQLPHLLPDPRHGNHQHTL